MKYVISQSAPTPKKRSSNPESPLHELTQEQPLAEDGIFYVKGDVDYDSLYAVIAGLTYIGSAQTEITHSTLIINTGGGEGSAMYELIDVMKSSKVPVATIASGQAMSAGFMILMAGTKGYRYATENTLLMSHQYAMGSGGKEHELVAAIKELEITSATMLKHYRKCTGKSDTYIRKHLLPSSDVYLTPEEAVKHGVIDKIIEIY